jgi:Concanavalin A-like lectin/glucanases superfamily
MPVITSVESGATGRYINLGTASALNNRLPITVITYCRPTGAGGGNLGYTFCKFPSGSSGIRQIVEHNSGNPLVSFGATSSGSANNPFSASASNSVPYNSWYHLISTCSASFTDSGILSSTIDNYINNVLSTPSTGFNGSGTMASDAANDLFLMNRGPSGSLGREFVGDIAYIAIWNRVLNNTERNTVMTSGPLDVPSGLLLCWANQQDYGPNAYTPTARSTFVAGTLPPNTSLGGGVVIPTTAGNATASGTTAVINTNAGTTISTVAGNATANGITAVISQGRTISTIVGNCIASGITANINTIPSGFLTDVWINNTGSAWAPGTSIHWDWFPSGRIGALNSPAHGTGTLDSNSKFLLTSAAAGGTGAGVLMGGVRQTGPTDDYIYSQAGTVT